MFNEKSNWSKSFIMQEYGISTSTWNKKRPQLVEVEPGFMITSLAELNKYKHRVRKPKKAYSLHSIQKTFGALPDQQKVLPDGSHGPMLNDYLTVKTILSVLPSSTFYYHRKSLKTEYCGLYHKDEIKEYFRDSLRANHNEHTMKLFPDLYTFDHVEPPAPKKYKRKLHEGCKTSYNQKEVLEEYGISDRYFRRKKAMLDQLKPTSVYLLACELERHQPEKRYTTQSVQRAFGARKSQYKFDELGNSVEPLKNYLTRAEVKTKLDLKENASMINIFNYYGLYSPEILEWDF